VRRLVYTSGNRWPLMLVVELSPYTAMPSALPLLPLFVMYAVLGLDWLLARLEPPRYWATSAEQPPQMTSTSRLADALQRCCGGARDARTLELLDRA